MMMLMVDRKEEMEATKRNMEEVYSRNKDK